MTFIARISAIFCLLWFMQQQAAAATSYETGPRHVGSAWNIYKGGLYLTGQGRFYSKHDVYSGVNNVETGVTVWDSQLSAGLFWGVTTHLQLGIVPILSQKNHVNPGESDSPGDLFVNAKFGSIGPARTKLALQFDLRAPTGAHHNIPLHPYSANSLGYGVTGLLSIHNRPSQPMAFAWDLNLGYFNHNDKGCQLTEVDSVTVAAPTTEMIVGTSATIMGKKLGLYAEIYGRFFIQQPPVTAYTRENSLTITPGVLYQFNPYIRLIAAVDLLLLGQQDETIYEMDGVEREKPWESVPNLPDWRFHFGLSFRLRQGKPPDLTPRPAKAVVVEEKASREEKPAQKDKKDRDGERDLRKLEEQLRRQSDDQDVETEAQRQQRMEAERQRMLDILQRLREAMREEAEKEGAGETDSPQ
ncbi:hypothetical protein JXA02_13045 [candidate division KSB1 bacterium]|nr:hypothetical protein [candidate division KSB1 bacterium]